MSTIGIFFGTDTGTTRLIAKKIAKNLKKRLGDDQVVKPLNINRIDVDTLLSYKALILGTPTYGEGVLPGLESDNNEKSWTDFLPQLKGKDFTGTRIALFGLGDQEKYPNHFVDGIRLLYDVFEQAGAELIGGCSAEGFEFNQSRSVLNERFIGLALDHHLQHRLTDERIDKWLDEVLPALLEVV